MALCNDLNLKNQLKKQKLFGKKELGEFCHQFGTSSFPIPSPSNNTKKPFPKVKRKFRYTKRYNREKGKPIKGKKPIKSKDIGTKPVVCWECGKLGHTRSQCKVRKKINELNISKEEKESLYALLNDSDDSKLEVLEVDNTESSESTSTSDLDNCDCNHPQWFKYKYDYNTRVHFIGFD